MAPRRKSTAADYDSDEDYIPPRSRNSKTRGTKIRFSEALLQKHTTKENAQDQDVYPKVTSHAPNSAVGSDQISPPKLPQESPLEKKDASKSSNVVPTSTGFERFPAIRPKPSGLLPDSLSALKLPTQKETAQDSGHLHHTIISPNKVSQPGKFGFDIHTMSTPNIAPKYHHRTMTIAPPTGRDGASTGILPQITSPRVLSIHKQLDEIKVTDTTLAAALTPCAYTVPDPSAPASTLPFHSPYAAGSLIKGPIPTTNTPDAPAMSSPSINFDIPNTPTTSSSLIVNNTAGSPTAGDFVHATSTTDANNTNSFLAPAVNAIHENQTMKTPTPGRKRKAIESVANASHSKQVPSAIGSGNHTPLDQEASLFSPSLSPMGQPNKFTIPQVEAQFIMAGIPEQQPATSATSYENNAYLTYSDNNNRAPGIDADAGGFATPSSNTLYTGKRGGMAGVNAGIPSGGSMPVPGGLLSPGIAIPNNIFNALERRIQTNPPLDPSDHLWQLGAQYGIGLGIQCYKSGLMEELRSHGTLYGRRLILDGGSSIAQMQSHIEGNDYFDRVVAGQACLLFDYWLKKIEEQAVAMGIDQNIAQSGGFIGTSGMRPDGASGK